MMFIGLGKDMKKLVVGFVSSGFMFLIPLTLSAETIVIPFDKTTIQEGIDVALDNDTVLVTPALYVENISFSGKNIVVSSSDGPSETVLQPANPAIPTVTLAGGEGNGTEFSGFTVTGGGNSHTVFIDSGASPLIRNNIFCNNVPFDVFDKAVVACWSDSGYPLITRNVFYSNGGITSVWIQKGKGDIINNTFDGNRSGFMCSTGLGFVRNNIVTGSLSIAIDGTFAGLDYNVLYNNNSDYG